MLFLLILSIIGSIISGFIITNSKIGSVQGVFLISGISVLALIALFQIFDIHMKAEEGDYLIITPIAVFYGLNVFQPLRIKNQVVGKILFVIVFSPMVVIIPYLFFLTFCGLKLMLS